MSQTEFIGFNSIASISKILKLHKPSRIFLATGKKSYESSGAMPIMEKMLKGCHAAHFNDFEENPKIEDVEKGIKFFKSNKCDFVIAVGGGSVIDIAKSVNILASNAGNPSVYAKNRKKPVKRGKILVAVPTTSGSGSEATSFAVVYVGKEKCSIESRFVLPDYAIVDPQLTLALPRNITASTGMDALSQSIESYWSVNSTNESKKYAGKAIRLVMEDFANAANNPSKESRESMSIAAHLAGKAINISKTTACHSISYPITSYFNVPHGHAVALTLAPMLVYNSNVTEDDSLERRGAAYVKKTINEIANLLGARDAESGASVIAGLMEKTGLGTRLSGLGIKTKKDIDVIIKNGFDESRVKNNPRLLTEEALREILEGIR